MFVKDLESLKYAELQKLAKSAGIKANQKVDKLLKALKEHYMEAEYDDDENDQKDTNTETSDSKDDRTQKTKDGKKSQHKKNVSASYSEERTNACAAEKRLENESVGASQLRTKFESTHSVASTFSHSPKSPMLFSPLRKAAFRKAVPLNPLNVSKTNVQDALRSSGEVVTNKPTRKRRTFELDEPTLSAQNTPSSDERSTRPSTANIQTDARNGPPSKRVRRNTYNKDSPTQAGSSDDAAEKASTSTSSPDTKAMIEAMDANSSSAERRSKLMTALERKVKNKASSSPSQTTQPSQIPRFVAYFTNTKTENQKPVTPGNKDWTRIHKKEFSKFDSLDVYLEKKQQRMEKLTGSAKQPMQTEAAGRCQSKIVKPVSRLAVPAKPFVPTVTSVKNISFNFIKTPVTQNGKAPSMQRLTPTRAKTPSTQAPTAAVGTSTKTTPFIFTGNNSTLNITTTSQKKTFDLKASLAKPLSWKPHTGKLQPLDFNRPQIASATKSSVAVRAQRPSRHAAAGKARPACAKDIRRIKHQDKGFRHAEQQDRRNNQKYIDMMKKRGLLN